MRQLIRVAAVAVAMSALLALPCWADEEGVSFVKDGELDIEAVVKHFEDLYRADSSVAVAELVVTRPRRTRTLKMKTWTKGRDRALVVVQEPARERGTATLKVGDNLWNYLPRIDRTIRIPPSMMLASWMGSDFTNDDLVRDADFSKDYEYSLAGRSEDPKGWVIRFDAKPDMVGLWDRMDLTVSEAGKLPLMARYYDRRGRLSRTMRWTEVREFGDRRLPSRMTLVPEDEEGHRTEFIYQEIEFGTDVPDWYFDLANLERIR